MHNDDASTMFSANEKSKNYSIKTSTINCVCVCVCKSERLCFVGVSKDRAMVFVLYT